MDKVAVGKYVGQVYSMDKVAVAKYEGRLTARTK